MVDAFTYEVLRHRLWTITVEGALALQRVSGSPLATEAFDMNTAIMTPDGEVAFVGPYLLTGPLGQGLITRYVIDNYHDNPGIDPGDVFLCNDPYVGAAHQNCVTVVAPIHHKDEVVAWCGATLHVIDVGGPQSGQVGIGALSIFEEAPPTPPIKIVRNGQLLRDVEAAYLRGSRTPELNGLDLRAKIGAINTIKKRVRDLAERYGTDAVAATMSTAIDHGVDHLRRSLAELPDGVYSHATYLDEASIGRTQLYAVRCRAEKYGSGLRFDFSASSPQAGAVINCTRSALWSGVLVGVLTYLVQGAPWCPAAVERVVEVVSESGTVVDAAWPAGCSMSTMAGGFAVTTASGVCLAQLLASSDKWRSHAMATWAGAVGSVDVFGTDASGRRFGTVLLDSMASGAGARAVEDGVDSGGFIRSMAAVIANVEHYEAYYPLLYLYRRQEPGTGGPGRCRGGVGVGYAVVAHGVERIEALIPHFSGTVQPESVGLAGGYPGARNQTLIVRGANVPAMFADGALPTDVAAMGGIVEILPGVVRTFLGREDVFAVTVTGGGGWGDPLERDPGAVEADVREQLVDLAEAVSGYGVVLRDGAADADATRLARKATRLRRAADAVRPEVQDLHRLGPEDGGPLHDSAEVTVVGDARAVRCRRCGYAEPCGTNPLARLPRRVVRLETSTADDVHVLLEERFCPGCWRLLAVDRTVRGSAIR